MAAGAHQVDAAVRLVLSAPDDVAGVGKLEHGRAEVIGECVDEDVDSERRGAIVIRQDAWVRSP